MDRERLPRRERFHPMRIEPRIVRYGGAMFDRDEIDAVMRQLQHPMGLVPGEKVCEFERRVAEYMGKAHGVMVNSGSSALMVAMRLANLPLGSEVITPVLTFSTTVAPHLRQLSPTPAYFFSSLVPASGETNNAGDCRPPVGLVAP